MLTAATLRHAIGSRLLIDCDGLSVLCDVLDARQCWDRLDLLVRPVAGGAAAKWIAATRASRVPVVEQRPLVAPMLHAPACDVLGDDPPVPEQTWDE